MGQVGTKGPHRLRSFDGVTVDTGRGEENVAAGPRLRIVHRRLLLCRRPLFEIPCRVDDHPEQNAGGLQAGIFGAVTNISSRWYELDPHQVLPIGNYVGFPGELGHPEAMRDIRRLELEEGWPSLARLTDRHMHLIRGHDAQLGVANFPPPLVADHRDTERVGGRDGALYIINRARRCEKEHKDGHNRDHCPGEFELIAAVDLRRLMDFTPRRALKLLERQDYSPLDDLLRVLETLDVLPEPGADQAPAQALERLGRGD